jgi:histidinol phosphatase-like PHP family hydrolase
MIDLHTHSLLSDGVLLPSELTRRAQVKGYKVIAITDHVDVSNIDFVLPRLIKASKELNKYWGERIKMIPGVEITHVPLEMFTELISYARSQGKVIIIGHGESPVEPVIKGTNRKAIESGVDILAHPGWIDENDAKLAKEKGIYLELTSRKGHDESNRHVLNVARKTGAKLVLDSDSHEPDDLLNRKQAEAILRNLELNSKEIVGVFNNSRELAEKFIA